MQIHGTVTITVDDVDIEQTIINKPHLMDGLPAPIQAGIAACQVEGYRKLWRILRDNLQSLQYKGAEKCKGGWKVTFTVAPWREEQEAA